MAVFQTAGEVFSNTRVVNSIKQNNKTYIGKTYSAKDVIKVWDCISKWIEKNMNQDKGILIKGIGYFTVAQWEINVGKGYPYTIRRPVFIINEKLAKDFNLKRSKEYNTGKIRERYLNFSSVAKDFNLNIDMVTDCFKEVVSAFRKLLHGEKNCELPFSNIGKLQIKNKLVTMKFYRTFLERQNQYLKNRTEEEKKKFQATSYNPDWDVDQYENLKRPHSAMSIINRPASSLSQYRPGTGYEGALPNYNIECKSRPGSSLSVQSYEQARPDSRLSVRSCEQTRPGSRLSVRSCEQTRPDSRLSVRSCEQTSPDSRPSVQFFKHTRPNSRLSSRSYEQTRPCSRLSIQTCEQSRPNSRLSMQSREQTRPDSRLSAQSCKQDRPGSRQLVQALKQSRPGSRSSELSMISCVSLNPSNKQHSSHLTKSMEKCNNSFLTAVRPSSKLSISSSREQDDKFKLMFGNGVYDEQLCYVCNIRKHRLEQIEKCRPDLTSMVDKDHFMKGDNPFNKLLNKESSKKRKNKTKEVSNYNYIAANKKSVTVNSEKNKIRNARNIDNFIFNKRPTSNSKLVENKINFKNTLLDQIKCNKIKKENDKITNINNERRMRQELLKNLHNERIKNIEAKNRSKQNYLMILKNHTKNKPEISEGIEKKYETTSTSRTIFGTNEANTQSDSKINKYCKNRQTADQQLKQHIARNLANQERKKKDMEFENNLLRQLKEEDAISRAKLLQKKYCNKKFLAEGLAAAETARRTKSEISDDYSRCFPWKRRADLCRLCMKNKLGIPAEKITDLPY